MIILTIANLIFFFGGLILFVLITNTANIVFEYITGFLKEEQEKYGEDVE